MILKIKKPQPQNIPEIIELMSEFARHSNLLEYLEVTKEDLHEVIFGQDSFVHSLIAFDNEKPIAYAFFYPTFSSFRGQKSVYLEDIFITKSYRKCGIGELLLRKIARTGKDFGAVRMDFQVLKQNEPAISFYKKYDALIDQDERHFKFVDEAFENLTK